MKRRSIASSDRTSADEGDDIQRFLAVLECEKIPEVIFERASRPRLTCGPTGDLVTTTFAILPEWILSTLDEEYSASRSNSNVTLLRSLLDSADISSRKLLRQTLSPEALKTTLFDILSVVIYAFPEPYTEILWQEAEARVWEVVDSTCLPFLAVIDLPDVLNYISTRSM